MKATLLESDAALRLERSLISGDIDDTGDTDEKTLFLGYESDRGVFNGLALGDSRLSCEP
jgi:hypothetical protein